MLLPALPPVPFPAERTATGAVGGLSGRASGGRPDSLGGLAGQLGGLFLLGKRGTRRRYPQGQPASAALHDAGLDTPVSPASSSSRNWTHSPGRRSGSLSGKDVRNRSGSTFLSAMTWHLR